jgi:ankyrin repeat protein
MTAVHIAVKMNDYDCLKLLLEYQRNIKTDVFIKDIHGRNAMDLA